MNLCLNFTGHGEGDILLLSKKTIFMKKQKFWLGRLLLLRNLSIAGEDSRNFLFYFYLLFTIHYLHL